jgi:alginate O-acetyltransferase complex protein AlgI
MSFWTCQALSYLLDLYREEELDSTLLEFCLYMAFAPTVLSGPICRLPDMLPQFREYQVLSRADANAAAQRIGLGALMMALAQLLGDGLRRGC